MPKETVGRDIKNLFRDRSFFTVLLLSGLMLPVNALADEPPMEAFEEKIPVQQEPMQEQKEDLTKEGPHWLFTITPVVNMMFFDDDRDRPLYGGHLDVRRSDFPLNFRIGVEGAHFDSEQASMRQLQLDQNVHSSGPEMTFLRIPFALEYMYDLGCGWELFGGGGYNIIRIDNLASDTGSAFHLSGRVGYSFAENFGISVEGGYLFAEDLDAEGRGDVELSGPFVSSGLYLRF